MGDPEVIRLPDIDDPDLDEDGDEDEVLGPPDMEHRHVDDDHQPVDGEAHPADSPLERLRAAYTRRLEVKRLVMEVPGWQGELLVEFGLLAPRDVKRLRATTRGARDDMTKVVADLLAVAHRGLARYDYDGEVTPLTDQGRQLRFADAGLITGHPVTTDRQGFLALFQEGPARQVNEAALQTFADAVGRWMADTSLQVDGAVDLTVDQDGQVTAEDLDPGS